MADTIRIVVVDDHPLFREGVAHSLDSDPRFEVLAEAASGEEAVEAARRLSPDMVVMDLNMSGCGGIAAAETISAILPAVRILMLTVAEDEDSLLAALKSGLGTAAVIVMDQPASSARSSGAWRPAKPT